MNKKPFNKLTPAEAERLALLMEEAAEVQQVIGKILRHGYNSKHPDGGPTNRELLEKELGHLLFSMDLLACKEDVSANSTRQHAERKRHTVVQYLHHTDSMSLSSLKEKMLMISCRL